MIGLLGIAAVGLAAHMSRRSRLSGLAGTPAEHSRMAQEYLYYSQKRGASKLTRFNNAAMANAEAQWTNDQDLKARVWKSWVSAEQAFPDEFWK